MGGGGIAAVLVFGFFAKGLMSSSFFIAASSESFSNF